MGLWQDDCLIARIVTKAILRGGFSFGADGLLTANKSYSIDGFKPIKSLHLYMCS